MKDEAEIFETQVSQAFWYIIEGSKANIAPAEIAFGREEPRHRAWFDDLFEGGIRRPNKGGRPLSLLITGPPGSCKTTLALEICYRLAASNLFSLYISTEAESDQLIANAESFGYEDVKKRIKKFGNLNVEGVAIWGKEQIKQWDKLSDIVQQAINALKLLFQSDNAQRRKRGFNITEWVQKDETQVITKVAPPILVIDSLNVVEVGERKEFFEEFIALGSNGTKLLILVLDSESSDKEHKYWEYVCDIILRLDYRSIQDYYLRTIEVVKARFQSHVWGKHQLKVYPKLSLTLPAVTVADKEKLRHSHPYRKEGGIFIYPSIHYYLSRYKRIGQEQRPEPSETYPTELNEILGLRQGTRTGGIPEGRCTAFIGRRGGHKSHLGYLHLLYRIIKHDEAGLIVSLRDDEEMTKLTLDNILGQEFPRQKSSTVSLEEKSQLETLYYHPGYITPEEFFHRMFISIHRLKRTHRKLTVLFNSLDQLSARFPLCAKQEIFIPGMIEALSGEGATSIFIGVNERDQPVEQYGLLPMADLILSFNPHKISFTDYYDLLAKGNKLNGKDRGYQDKVTIIKQRSKEIVREEILLQVVRSAGGQRAGAHGLLELVDRYKLGDSLHRRPGLHFTVMNQW
jgi:KaiC/GvpD/RAD55 family RecA-like ATPase